MTDLDILAKSLGLRITRATYSGTYTIETPDGAEIYSDEREEGVRAFLLGWIACLSRSKS